MQHHRFARALLLPVLALLVRRAPAQAHRDTVFIVPGSHLDVGFTAPIESVAAERIRILDEAIGLAERDPHFVWFEEGGWSVEKWLDHYHSNPGQIARLARLMKAGRIGVGATLLSPHAAAFPGSLRFLTMHLDRIEHELGARPSVAVINDVPAVPEALVDALAAAGIRYLLMGPNLVFSDPLPTRVTSGPFYWQSARGSRVLVAVDAHGYGAGLTSWFLPPDCVRFLAPQQFPATMSDDSILSLGVRRQLALRPPSPLAIVQHASDNGDPGCVARLDAAADRWNARRTSTVLLPSLPSTFFTHLELRLGASLPVRRGEWGGDWDLLRASEPVWSWRLRTAIDALTRTSPRQLQFDAVTVTDHNVGLGPRWLDGVPAAVARAHVAQVAELYRRVVSGALGAAALSSQPPAIPMPSAAQWPAAWSRIIGERSSVARVRAGPAFLFPFVDLSAPTVPARIEIGADDSHVVIHTAIDRLKLEEMFGPRYQAVIEVTLHAPVGAISIVPEGASPSPAAWLLGTPRDRIVAPQGVRIAGPGWILHAHGPLLIGWTLVADRANPAITRLQALAVIHAVSGMVEGRQQLRLPFADMYPGEPAVPLFDLELRRTESHAP